MRADAVHVSLFVTCLTDLYFPEVAESTVRVLKRLGVTCDFPSGQTCCGQPALNSGFLKEAAAVARRMIDIFADSKTVVTPSGSCCAMVREYFPHLLRDDKVMHPRAVAMAAKTFDIVEFLQKQLKVDWTRWDLPYSGIATYHYSCHNRGLGMAPEDIAGLLKHFRGLEYRPLEKMEQCCGFGGTFAVKYGDISGAMVKDKVDCIKATGADTLVCNDGGCTLNIIGALRRQGVDVRTEHVISMLDRAMKAGRNQDLLAADEAVSLPSGGCCCEHGSTCGAGAGGVAAARDPEDRP